MNKVYQVITDRVLKELESGNVAPWSKPWKAGELAPQNLVSGKAYKGCNLFITSFAPFESPYWLSYKQAQAKGGQVKKGEKGTPIIYWNFSEHEDKKTGEKKNVPFVRYSTVFNTEQIEGIDVQIPDSKQIDFNPIQECERLFDGYLGKPVLKHESQGAYYRPSQDYINMPNPDSFNCNEEYYSTLFHEMTHSTGHESRLKRKGIDEIAAFGSAEYSKEELIAEMGAAYLCGIAGIENKTINNSISYLKAWSSKLRSNPKWIIEASSQAQKAVDYIRYTNHKNKGEA